MVLERPLKWYVEVVILTAFYRYFPVNSTHQFRLSFGTEKLAGIPLAIVVAVVQQAQIVLAGQKKRLIENSRSYGRFKNYGIILYKLQHGVLRGIDITQPDVDGAIFLLAAGGKRKRIGF